MSQLAGLHVLVTGASSGIGEGLARAFAAAGSKLTLVARRKEMLETLAASLPGPPSDKQVIAADLGDPQGAAAVLVRAEAALGPIDILVNNAGMQIIAPAEETDPAAGERLLKLNVETPMRLIIAVLPGMIARRRGTIVNIASLAGVMPTAGMFYYNASKGALGAASEGLRGEVRRHGIDVLTVYPGPVSSPMEAAAWISFDAPPGFAKRLPTGTPAGLARLVLSAIKARRRRVIYPRFYWLAAWFHTISRWITDRVTPPLKSKTAPVQK